MKSTCPFCNEIDAHSFIKTECNNYGNKVKILGCKNCNIIYPALVMTGSESNTFINDIVYEEKFSDEDFIKHVQKDYFVNNLLKKYTRRSGNALDIGAYIGGFLVGLNRIGFNAYGIDICKNAVNFSLEKKLNNYHCSFENIPANLKNKKYSLIVFMETFYYFQNVTEVLSEVFELLDNNGYLLIQTINSNSNYFNKNTFFSRYGDNALFFPSFESIIRLLENNNFKIEISKPLPKFYINQLLKYNGMFGYIVRRFGIFLHYITTVSQGLNDSDKVIIFAKKKENL